MEDEIIKTEKCAVKMEREIKIYDDKIDDVAKRMAEKMGIDDEKAKTELKMGIIMGMMMNRHHSNMLSHKVQEMNEE